MIKKKKLYLPNSYFVIGPELGDGCAPVCNVQAYVWRAVNYGESV